MTKKHTLLIGVLLAGLAGSSFAISTAKIDAVRNKEAIAESDTAIIEEFIKDAFSELLERSSLSDTGSARMTIISKSTSASQSGQILYGPKYIAVVKNELISALKKVNTQKEETRKTILTTNLIMIINDLANYETSRLALEYLESPNTMIRYWAANSATNPNLIKQLNESSEDVRNNFTQKILNAAKAEESADIVMVLARAGELKSGAVNEIMTTLAQKRIDLYNSWNVSNEITDEAVLKGLADRSKTEPESAKIMGKYFATLYSLMIQRYALGQETLNDASKTNLVSAIVQSEKNISVYVEDWSGNFKRAIEKGGASGLLIEHDALFGSAGSSGKMPSAVGFDYGKNADGSAIVAPATLSKPVAAK